MAQAGAWIRCSNCGTVNAASEQFCTNCGYALNNPSSQGNVQPHNAPTVPNISPVQQRRVTGALSPQTLLAGRYRIVRLVGRGGFGVVYESTHDRLGYVVAIKEMSDAQLSPAEKVKAIQDFDQEAKLLVPLKHPNLPNVSDRFEDGGKAYLVMEFIEGKTLEKIQEDANVPLDERMVMSWALQLCDVLGYLHTRPQPIIFRDMKPSNVMLTKDGQIKLIDFGIARNFKSTAQKDTQSLGSRGYAPLEQYGKGQTDARSDIYALGATLYDLLTHNTPTDAITRRIQKVPLTRPRQLNPRISQATENIILKAMEEEPQQRFQSVQAMAQAIVVGGVVPSAQRAPQQPTPHPPTLPPQPPQPTPGQSVPGQAPPQRGISRRVVLIGGGAAVVAAVALSEGVLHWPVPLTNSTTPGVAVSKISLDFIFSTEKNAWLEAAINDFNKQQVQVRGKVVEVQFDDSGSLDIANQIVAGQKKPVVWSPSSMLELNRLSFKWQQAHGQGSAVLISTGNFGIQSLASSPLVFALWKERADAFLNYYGSINWTNIADALGKKGWGDLRGPSDWGAVKFGQTRPTMSNSGLLTLTLIAYNFFKEQRQLTQTQVNDQKFLAYLNLFESAVNGFGLSSGTYMEQNVIPSGPAQADIIMTYENLVLTLQQEANNRQHQPLLMFYPSLNIVSDHPFAILNGSWVSDEQKQAAQALRDFLLTDAQQRNAVQNGFRPVSTNVQISSSAIPNNPFAQFSQISPKHSVSQTIQPLAQAPSGGVIDALLQQWNKAYGSAS